MIGREGPGPERPGPDYPPEWDTEPEPDDCTCMPYPYGDGPERDCPTHGDHGVPITAATWDALDDMTAAMDEYDPSETCPIRGRTTEGEG